MRLAPVTLLAPALLLRGLLPVLLIALLTLATPAHSWDSGQLAEPVRIGSLDIVYPEFAIFPLPGTRLPVSAAGGLTLLGENGEPAAAGSEDLTELVVPQRSGWYQYRLRNNSTGQELQLHIYALVPYSELTDVGRIEEYRVGDYPNERLRDQAIYDPPLGFIRVEEAHKNIRVSPNFTVGQFLSKQSGGYPKYLVLRSALTIKLERILQALNEVGHDAASMHVMSGFRTPFYNRAIGNVQYSRHVWGGAADIYVDVNPKDGIMDDLDRDGLHDKNDAVWLAGFIDAMARDGKFDNLGGVGIYGSNAAHGPFVHVDVRGYRARW